MANKQTYLLGGKLYTIKQLYDAGKAVDSVTYPLLRKRLTSDFPWKLHEALRTPKGYKPGQYEQMLTINAYLNTGRWTVKELSDLFQLTTQYIYHTIYKLKNRGSNNDEK